MKAVNLIPADQRRSTNPAGKSGGAAHGLLVLVALAVIAITAITLTNRSVAESAAKADALEAQAQAAAAKAGELSGYKEFTELVKTRSAGVQALASTRFDWGTTLEQVSKVVPEDVSLTQLGASLTTAQGGSLVNLRSALENPAIELVGCAPSQSDVALLMARLRRLEGVERVSLSNSDKGDGESAGASSAASTGCQTTDQVPKFQIVAFFGTPTAAASTSQAPAGSVKAAIDTINGGTSGTTTTPAPATPGS